MALYSRPRSGAAGVSRRKLRIFGWLAWPLAAASWLWLVHSAQAEPLQSLTLPQFLAEVEQRSPLLAARRGELRAAMERPAQAGAMEDPMLMLELWQVPVRQEQLPLMVTLRQPVPWPGKLRARAKVMELEPVRARADVADTARSLKVEATRAYFDHRLAIRSAEVLRELQQLLNSIVSAVEIRYRVGRAELAELLKAQTEAASLDSLLLDTDRERDLAATAMNQLLARESNAPVAFPITAPEVHALPPLAKLLTLANSQRPELRSAEAALVQAQAREHAASVEQAPDLAVWASYMASLRGTMEQTFTVGVQSSIPSFSLAKSRAAGREAQAQAGVQRAMLQQVAARIGAEVRQAVLRIQTVERHLQLHSQTLLPTEERAVRAAQVSYQNGKISLALLLDAVRGLLGHRLEYERFLAEYGQRMAELEAAIGGPIPLEERRTP